MELFLTLKLYLHLTKLFNIELLCLYETELFELELLE